jgi:mRNA interferase RelE/StbE
LADYSVVIADPAKREARKLPEDAKTQVARALTKLATCPRPSGAEKLRSQPSFYRIRSGDYRIIYAIRPALKAAIVVVIRHRKDAFRGLEELDGKLADALVKVTDNLLECSAVSGSA